MMPDELDFQTEIMRIQGQGDKLTFAKKKIVGYKCWRAAAETVLSPYGLRGVAVVFEHCFPV